MVPIAAVTGASRGIGRVTTWELARMGYRVFALARSVADLEALAEEGRRAGHDIVPVTMDISNDASRRAAIGAILEATGGYGLDVLINNAGYGQLGPLEELSVEQMRRQLEVNVVGLLAFTQSFLPGMRERRKGRVVNIGSIAGRISVPFMGAYSASKYALEAISDALRLELAPFGVHVILIEPGPIATEFGRAAGASAAEDPSSPYARFLRGYGRSRALSDFFTRPAESVAHVIARAIRSRHPQPRYTVTINARIGTLTYRLVPGVVLDWVLRRAMGLR